MVKITDYELEFDGGYNPTISVYFKYECTEEEQEKIGDDGIAVTTRFYDEEDPIPDLCDDLSDLEDEIGIDIELADYIVDEIENEIRDQLEEWDLEEQGERDDYYRAIGLW